MLQVSRLKPPWAVLTLFQLLASVWESGDNRDISESESWQSSVVVPLAKGDVHESDVGNFSGISLLSVALKILCTELGTNLSRSFVVEEQVVESKRAFASGRSAWAGLSRS